VAAGVLDFCAVAIGFCTAMEATCDSSGFYICFDKGNIIILRDINYTEPLQQRNTLMAVRMHTPKKAKKKLRKQKIRYGIPALAATIHPPPRKHLNSKLSKRDTSKKGTVHKCRHRLIKDLRFSP
jgi:hypothetical protein